MLVLECVLSGNKCSKIHESTLTAYFTHFSMYSMQFELRVAKPIPLCVHMCSMYDISYYFRGDIQTLDKSQTHNIVKKAAISKNYSHFITTVHIDSVLLN